MIASLVLAGLVAPQSFPGMLPCGFVMAAGSPVSAFVVT
jgi:hypothetical protein